MIAALHLCLAAAIVSIALLGSELLAAEPSDSLDLPSDSLATIDTISVAAFVEFDSSRIVIRDNSHAEFFGKRRVRVLREAGLSHGTVQLYENALVKLDDFRGRVFAANGTEILKRSGKDLHKDCGFGGNYTLYDDVCFYTAMLSAGNYPFTVEYEYKESLLSFFAWPEWTPQTAIPVLSSSYTVDAPTDFEFRTDCINLGARSYPATETLRGRTISTWSATSVSPFDPEPQSPPAYESMQRLDFSPQFTKMDKYPLDGSDWSSLARSYYEIARKQLQISGKLESDAGRLLADDSYSGSPLKGLHHALMSRLRYVAISIGIGGWQPHSANDTYHNRYGDCKDLSTLYAALLTHAGYQAHLALVRTKDIGQINPKFPTLSIFNHVIVALRNGREITWIDPTCSVCELGDIPNGVEDVYALVIDPEDGGLARTPLSPPDKNLITRKFKIRIGTDNSAMVVLDIEASGNASHSLKYAAQEMTFDEFGEYLQRRDFLPKNLKIDHCYFNKFDSTFSRFSCQVSGSIRRVAQRLDDRVHLKGSIIPSPISTDLPDITDRIQPIVLGSTMTVSDDILLEIPEEWSLAELPDSQPIESAFGSLTISAQAPPDTSASVTVSRKHTVTIARVMPPDFESYREFQKACTEALASAVVFKKR